MKKFVSDIFLILVALIVGLLTVFALLFCIPIGILAFYIFPHFVSFSLLGVVILLLIFCRRLRSEVARRRLRTGVKFTVSMIVMTIVCAIVWQVFVTEYLYDNTDDNLAGFLGPFYGDLLIGQGGFPVVTVQQVVHGRSMSDPDEIKAGWSIPKLLCLWFSFVVASLIISAALAKVPWNPKRLSTSKALLFLQLK
jgi:hypothetical protein